jgi:hypothetical protein
MLLMGERSVSWAALTEATTLPMALRWVPPGVPVTITSSSARAWAAS